MSRLKVGYLALAKGSWINDRLEAQRRQALGALGELDADIVDCGRLVQDEPGAAEACRLFAQAGVDAVLAHFVTFTLGSIVPGIAVKLGKPVIFWSEPEPPMTGGRIAANSFCATNMNAHALWKMGLKYLFVHGRPDEVLPELARRFRVLDCVLKLRRARIGLLGGRVPGFYTSCYDELALRARFGTEVEVVTMLELARTAEALDGGATAAARRQVEAAAESRVSPAELDKAAALFAAFRQMAEKYRLDAWAVRCWPEFGDLLGIAVCRVLGCLTGGGAPAACEGDVHGALAMLAGKALSGSDAFFCDLVSFDRAGDTGLFWHCGAAPDSLCRPGCLPRLCKHSVMDGGDRKGVTGEFPLKPGPVTVLRIGETRRGDGYRLLSLGAEGVETGQALRGNPLSVRFRRPAAELAWKLVENGFEHHYILCHGDITGELELFAGLLDLELVAL